MGIVIDLQKEALSKDTDILSLIRKAYLVARKLNLMEFKKWLEHEMNGYESGDKVPAYRIYHGEVKAWNPYHGWVPVIFQDVKNQNTLSEHKAREPIASLVDVYNHSEGKVARVPFPDSINDIIPEKAEYATKYCLQLSTNQIFVTIDIIRNTILDWAITLEENGILGDGLQFSSEEIDSAKTSDIINNFITNIYGDVDNTNIQQGTTNSSQRQMGV